MTAQWEVPVTPAAPRKPHCVRCASAVCVVTTGGGSVKKSAVKECAVYGSDVWCREGRAGMGKLIEDSDVGVGKGEVLLRGGNVAGRVQW